MCPDEPIWPPAAGGVPDSSTDPASPIAAPASPRNRALRDFVSVLDYGTYTSGDMTSTWAAALADASAKGNARGAKMKLLAPPNAYQITSLVPQSYVDIHAHGASFTRPASYALDRAFFFQSVAGGVGAPFTHFALRGAVVNGTGAETAFQGLFLCSQSSHVTVEDCETYNLASFLGYFGDCQYVWADRNKGFNNTVQNALNFVSGGGGATSPLKHIWARANHIENCQALGIAIVSTGGSNRTDPDVDAHIESNTCIVNGAGWPIGVEQGGTTAGGAPNVKNIHLISNTCVQIGTGLYAMVLTNDSTPLSNDPLCISGVTAVGNHLYSLGAGGVGLLCLASRSAITANYIEAAVDDIKLQGHGTATIGNLTIVGNVGHLGTGKEINIIVGDGVNTGHVDTTTLTSTNTL